MNRNIPIGSMVSRLTRASVSLLATGSLSLLFGCPAATSEFIAGQTGNTGNLGTLSSVEVFSPTGDLQIAGGTPVDVNYRVVATTSFSAVDIFFDLDQDPDNGNEVFAAEDLAISETNRLLNTSSLEAATYFVGVALSERNELAAFDYAPGRLIVNQQPFFFFSSPRDNFEFDRTTEISPRFDVAWQVLDRDSTVAVQIFLDPDDSPNGNEVLLRESANQSGDSFSFDLPTITFEPGVYRILAVVSDGTDTFNFYAPGTIRLRSRLAGVVDLRLLAQQGTTLAGAVFEGFNPLDNCGSFVSGARDADNDGFSDFIMLAQFGKPDYSLNLQRAGIGEGYLVYGRPQRFSGSISVNSIGTLLRGDVIGGAPEVIDPIRPSRGITSFAVCDDWDRDGVRELAFGLPFTDSTPAFPAPLLDPAGYFRSGSTVIMAGCSLRPDFAFPGGQLISLADIGTEPHEPFVEPQCPMGFYGPKAPPAEQGGASTFFHRYLADINIVVDRIGCRISSNSFGDQFGEAVSAFAYQGLIMSAPNRDPISVTLGANDPSVPGGGAVSIFYNSSFSPFYPWVAVNTPPANAAVGYPGLGANGGVDFLQHGGPYHFSINETRLFNLDPRTVSPGYRVDADNGEPCLSQFDGRVPQARANATVFFTFEAGARLSASAALPDFNSDGLQDVLLGAPLARQGAGLVFIVLGRLEPIMRGSELNVDELALPLVSPGSPGLTSSRAFDGIRVVGAESSRLGLSQDSAGDFNGDGLTDVIIGSPLLNNRRGGAGIFFGSRDAINLTEAEIPFVELPARGLGVIFAGDAEGDLAGARVKGVGDLDGDGLDDILIAAPDKSIAIDLDQNGSLDIDRQQCGVVYVIYGSRDLQGTIDLADVGTQRLPGAVFIGRSSFDQLGGGIGLQGDRSFGVNTAGDVDGDGRADLLLSSVTASPRNRVNAGEVYLIYGVGD